MVRPLLLICAMTLALALILAGSHGSAQGDWTQSKWGPDDEIGSANYVTPERVVKAAQLVKTGKLDRLGAVTSAATPAFPPREYKIHVWRQSIPSSNKLTYTDDMVTAWLGVGSQIDGFGHIGIDHVHYNGTKADDFVALSQVLTLPAVPWLAPQRIPYD